MDLQLQDKTAIVSGGAAGIGRAIAAALAAEGANVAIVDLRPEDDASPVPQERRLWITGNLSDAAVCEQAVRQTVERFGRIDVLVNNAGVNDSVGLDAGPEAFTASLERNVVHYYSMVHYALDSLAATRGSIVNIGSKVSFTGQGGTSGYAAAKGAVAALTREWAAELASRGVRVNGVIPAEVWTDMYAAWLDQQPHPAAQKAAIERSIPLGQRFTLPEEIANMVVFLASSAASHITGQLMFVDGGYTHLDRRLNQ